MIVKAKKNALNNYLCSVVELEEYANKMCVSLYLENLSNYKHYSQFRYIFTHMEEFEFILNATALHLFLDVGHANIGDGEPCEIFKNFINELFECLLVIIMGIKISILVF